MAAGILDELGIRNIREIRGLIFCFSLKNSLDTIGEGGRKIAPASSSFRRLLQSSTWPSSRRVSRDRGSLAHETEKF